MSVRILNCKPVVYQRERSFRRIRASSTQEMVPAIKVESGKTRVGWVGTGVMGSSMCGHVMDAGFSASVFNRTVSKTDGLQAKGAKLYASPKEVAENSDVVFTIVGYPSDVHETILGVDGVLAGLKPGAVIVDMTTSDPSLAQEIAKAAAEKGIVSLDAPVSGGDMGARNGTLSIMCGGPTQTVQALSPLFAPMGNLTHMGPAGAGQSCKIANQVTIATTMIGLVEGLIYAHAAGLDLEQYLTAIRGGAAGSKSLELYSSRILKRDMAPGFMTKHFIKDLGIALQECQKMNLSLPGLALAQQLYVSLAAHDEGDCGTQALVLAFERMNHVKLPTIESKL